MAENNTINSPVNIDSVVFISGNKGKISELSSILAPTKVISKDIDLPEVQTIYVEEVVKEKVLTAWNEVKEPLFVEDTGLYITSPPMNGFPGALIKFYYKYLDVSGICEKNGGDKVYAESIIGYHDGTKVHMFKGVIHGSIANKPQNGDYGFGWDSIFIPDENNPNKLSFAQLPPEIKNTMSMRKRAAVEFKKHLEETH
jgi:XTP/dITP diphosphohydrolase